MKIMVAGVTWIFTGAMGSWIRADFLLVTGFQINPGYTARF